MTSQDKKNRQAIDEFEDLTQFADESFDTDEVDLFEFTGGGDSPLTRLKSIILSLDWEINDDILDELTEEVASLRTLWEGDKVAQVYLQGLDKVGKYLKLEGAYAHPNAIKLLLTLFYNYEKIISSPNISGDTITALLKSDIRKFKVLQYQIGRIAASADTPTDEIIAQGTIPEQDLQHLAEMEATILGLEWEVTDEDLTKFSRLAGELRGHLAGNQPAQVLIQGLQALGAYISDEKYSAHPDAFTLLHSFFDGLKIIVGDKGLDSEKIQEILIERVSSLNSLKEIIARSGGIPGAEPEITEGQVLDLGEEMRHEQAYEEASLDSSPADTAQPTEKTALEAEEQPAADLDEDLAVDISDAQMVESINAAMETADEQYPEDILDPEAIVPLADNLADDFIEEELKLSAQWDSSLDSEPVEADELSMDDEGLSDQDLEDELELLFIDDAATEEGNADESTAADALLEDLELDFAEDTVVDDSATPDLDLADVLADAEGTDEEIIDFGDDLFLTEDEGEQAASGDELISPALADADEEMGFSEDAVAEGLDREPTAELEDKLDSFFGSLGEEEETVAVPAAGDDDLLTPALADADEEMGFSEDAVAEGLDREPTAELDDKLDSFFAPNEQEPDIELDSSGTGTAASGLSLFSALTAAAASLPATPEKGALQQVAESLAACKDENYGLQQKIVLNLIDSAVTLLLKTKDAAVGNTVIIRELANVLHDDDNPAVLVEAVGRYTGWQQELFDEVLSLQRAGQPGDKGEDDMASQVRAGFSELRDALSKELEAMKRELKQG